jgi:hypothetical protein
LSATITTTAQSQSQNKTAKQLSISQRWAMACPALLTEANHQQHDLLSCAEPSLQNVSNMKATLQRWWAVSDRDGLLKALSWVDEGGGHRRLWDECSQVQADDDLTNLEHKWQANHWDRQEWERKLQIIHKYEKEVGKKGLLGWDYCRFIALCRWGVLCNYLSEDEAWRKIMPVARKLQSKFSSWSDLGKNYLIGREFWSGEETAQNGVIYQKNYEKLLSDKSSPWVTIPWNTNLGTSP